MSAQAKEFTGRHMWVVVAGFFGVIIAVNIGMAIVASTSWTGLVVPNSYVASQEFEDKRLAHEAQLAAGWQVTFGYAAGVAKLVAVDGAGNLIDLGRVTVKVNRPVGGHDDQVVVLDRGADGEYRASLTLAAGVWDVLVEAPDTPKGPFELHERITAEAAR